ncbi:MULTISPECIES: GNAT family N-acetyltransferase [unclassified Crossiella]|uniref:GNAT family N-acetyltransferase n=1 Tax=unclassified Crossiella TaxID=2620835 RepID=UPI001FFEB256|nr:MULTISPECIES: GNAT family N-acetyltransferase [unclassified Crossiella]MCK2239279.1 GNAT family N-acetyltransferase [Crossiella sp. S99.2]MCK2251151.1 GNAT family N-acetyltransferase [Crossiella sp. S99.1]
MTDLIRRWQQGWSACRGWAPPVESHGALDFLLGQPDRHRELITLHVDAVPDSVRPLADVVATQEKPTLLTVPTHHPDEVEQVLREAGLTLRAYREWIMTREVATHPQRPAPAGYTCQTTVTGRVISVEVRHESGDLAASGLAAVIGTDTVPDKIVTTDAHRRRGLGSVVMGALMTEAANQGASTGILFASPDGERLYTALGWVTEATVVMATSPRHAA